MTTMTLAHVRTLAWQNPVLEHFVYKHYARDAHNDAIDWMLAMGKIIRWPYPKYANLRFRERSKIAGMLQPAFTMRDIEDAYGVLDHYTDWLSENGYENN